jgi:hypothetical protein
VRQRWCARRRRQTPTPRVAGRRPLQPTRIGTVVAPTRREREWHSTTTARDERRRGSCPIDREEHSSPANLLVHARLLIHVGASPGLGVRASLLMLWAGTHHERWWLPSPLFHHMGRTCCYSRPCTCHGWSWITKASFCIITLIYFRMERLTMEPSN